MALWESGRMPAMLNYSQGPATMLACASLAGLKHVVTSRAFIEQARLKLGALHDAGIHFIHLEDLGANIRMAEKLIALLRTLSHPRSARRNRRSDRARCVV